MSQNIIHKKQRTASAVKRTQHSRNANKTLQTQTTESVNILSDDEEDDQISDLDALMERQDSYHRPTGATATHSAMPTQKPPQKNHTPTIPNQPEPPVLRSGAHNTPRTPTDNEPTSESEDNSEHSQQERIQSQPKTTKRDATVPDITPNRRQAYDEHARRLIEFDNKPKPGNYQTLDQNSDEEEEPETWTEPNEVPLARISSKCLISFEIYPFTEEEALAPLKLGSTALTYFTVLRDHVTKWTRAKIHLRFMKQCITRQQVPKGLRLNRSINVIGETPTTRISLLNIFGKAEKQVIEAIHLHYITYTKTTMEAIKDLMNAMMATSEVAFDEKRNITLKLIHEKNKIMREKLLNTPKNIERPGQPADQREDQTPEEPYQTRGRGRGRGRGNFRGRRPRRANQW